MFDGERAHALDAAAAGLGVRPGMRRGGVAALAPGARMAERDLAAERAALEAAARAALRFTPRVEQAGDGCTLSLDVGASLALFGGPRALGRQALAAVRALGLRARLGMAPTAAGARLLACRAGPGVRRRTLRPGTLARQLDRLSCALLPQALPHLEWLDGIGCRELGQLRRLPRAGLQRRCGPALLPALDAAYGRAAEGGAPYVPPPRFAARIELPERSDHGEAVFRQAQRLLARLCDWLDARQLAATRLAFALEHGRGRHAGPPTRLDLALSRSAWLAAHFEAPLRERLSRTVLQAPVAAVALDVRDLSARPALSAALFPDPASMREDHARLLDLLRARLGAEAVAHAAPRADHRPEIANGWHAGPPQRRPPAAAPGAERPCWLLAEPLPLAVRGDRPVHGSPLRLLRGPERIECGWWDRPWTLRDYFVAEDERAVRYWIYRERDARPVRWFLHGLFG